MNLQILVAAAFLAASLTANANVATVTRTAVQTHADKLIKINPNAAIPMGMVNAMMENSVKNPQISVIFNALVGLTNNTLDEQTLQKGQKLTKERRAEILAVMTEALAYTEIPMAGILNLFRPGSEIYKAVDGTPGNSSAEGVEKMKKVEELLKTYVGQRRQGIPYDEAMKVAGHIAELDTEAVIAACGLKQGARTRR